MLDRDKSVEVLAEFIQVRFSPDEISELLMKLNEGGNDMLVISRSTLDSIKGSLETAKSQAEEARDYADSAKSELEDLEYQISNAKEKAEEAQSEADSASDSIQEALDELDEL